MSNTDLDEEAIFHIARQISSDRARTDYLASACGNNQDLLWRLRDLLLVHEHESSFLKPPREIDTTFDIPALSERPGTQIGTYKLREQIGEGGFGVVYVAEQEKPVARKVALKIIKPGMDTRDVIARFEAERQALALMDHPNVAKVLDAGAMESGRPFFVMELVKGAPITDFCDERKLSTRERLELFIDVCRAVQHAHQKGIIHRDLKPSNVMVTLHDDRPVVKVIDFGIAKALSSKLTDKTVYTAYGQIVGTPLYMSPEQARFSGLDVDTRSDVYSLGVLLYELLTGTTPFDKDSLADVGFDELRRIIREDEPPRPSARISTLKAEVLSTVSSQRHIDPRRLSQSLRGDLDWIVMKALEKDRNRRYETTAAFAADVERFLADEPVQARPPSMVYKLGKFARRNKRGLLTASVVVLGVVLTAAGSGVLIWHANQDLHSALEREQHTSYFQRITLAHRDLSTDNLGRALTLLNECPENLRGWEWYYLMRLCHVDQVDLRHDTGVTSVAFSPNGGQLAAACKDGTIKIWSTATRTVVLELTEAHANAVACVAFHPDGTHLASAGIDCFVRVWDLTSAKAVFEEKVDYVHVLGTSQVVAFSHDGQHLAACFQGDVNVWDWQNQKIVDRVPEGEKRSMAVAFSSDGQLATGTWNGSLKLWHPEKRGTSPRSLSNHRRHPVSDLSFSSDGRRLASASFDRTVKVWNVATGEQIHTLMHPGLVMSVAFSPDDRLLASAGQDRVVRIWDAVTGREVLALRGHREICTSLVFSPDGHYLASSSQDGTVRLWDATPLKGNETQEIMTFSEHNDEVHCVTVSPDGETVVSCDFDRMVKVWDAKSLRVMLEFPGPVGQLHDQMVFWLAWHPDSRRIASAGSADGLFTVKVWDARTGREEFSLPPGSREYQAVAFSPEGKFLVTGRADGAVELWDAETGHPRGTLGYHERSAIRGLSFSPSGEHLVSAAVGGSVKLWDATRWEGLDQPRKPRHSFQGRVPGISVNVAFSPDGRRFAMGDQDYTVTIRDVKTGQPIQILKGQTGEIYAVAFSPVAADGWIATAGEDSTVRIWDSETGRLVRTFRGHLALVTSLSFSSDGERLYSGSQDKTVKIWDIAQLRDAQP